MAGLLDVRHLNIEFPARNGRAGSPASTRSLVAVRDLSFTMQPGEVLGLVGESGSGKSLTSLAIMRLLPNQARASGEIVFGHGKGTRDLFQLADDEMRSLRGSRIAMIFQEPMTALNPVMRVGEQIAEAVLAHGRVRRRKPGRGPSHAMNELRFPMRSAVPATIRTNFPAACGSAS